MRTLYIGKAKHQAKFNEYIKQIYAQALNKKPSEVLLSDVLDDFSKCR